MVGGALPDVEQGPSLHRLTLQEMPRAIDVLVRAFDCDPFVDWVVRSDAGRQEGMRRFFTVCLRYYTMPFDEVWATRDIDGVAMWTPPPGTLKSGPSQQARFFWQAVRGMQLRNVPSRLSAFSEIERHHPRTPHYYLFFLGVDPERQGEGIGSRMLVSMLNRCDTEGMPAYLEATHAGLIPFYGHHGYQERPPILLPHGGPALYPMWRDPRPSE